MGSEARATHEGVQPVPGQRGRVEVRLVEIAATASQEWTLPREGASVLQLRASGGYVRCHVRLARVEGDQIQVRAVKEARGESEADAQTLLQEMKIERRREGDRWIVEASWPHRQRRRRTGINSYTEEDPRLVIFEFHLPRGMSLDLSNLNLSDSDMSGQDLREVNLDAANLSGARLAEADLTGNELSRLNLSGARLNRAHLPGR